MQCIYNVNTRMFHACQQTKVTFFQLPTAPQPRPGAGHAPKTGQLHPRPLSIPPTESIREGPINKPAFADQILLVEVTEPAPVLAIQLIVAHRQVAVGMHLERCVSIRKQRRDPRTVEYLRADFVVDVTAIGRVAIG